MSGFTCLSPAFGHRCNKCSACIALRSWLRLLRYRLELYDHEDERAWFITLTNRPGADEAYAPVQRWLKRLRKSHADKKIRYVSVEERGARNDRLHYHLLLFSSEPIRYRELPEWLEGHKLYKLATPGALAYVVKYISKGGKLRSSIHMGCAIVERTAEHPLVAQVLRDFPGSSIRKIRQTVVPKEMAEPFVQAEPYMVHQEDRAAVLHDIREAEKETNPERDTWLQLGVLVNKQAARLSGRRDSDDRYEASGGDIPQTQEEGPDNE